jgi:Zinc carboxypeptidase
VARWSLRWSLLLATVVAVVLLAPGRAQAAIAPPWCGDPIPDGVGALPDGSDPSHPVGSFPHIPWYAIGCTLDDIAARSNGRMTVEVIGQSALGRDMYLVKINALETVGQRQAFQAWRAIREIEETDPAGAQQLLGASGGTVKVPLYIQAGIHGNESEGVDASMMIIERLATTPYGQDAEVDQILDEAIVLFNVVHNPDGRILNQRANGFNFDLNRDFLTQSQSETKASVKVMQDWLPPETLDLHGYVTPTLIEATTKPHNPGIDYDLWLKWNQSRIDANEAAMNAIGLAVTRPINDWCSDGNPAPASGICPDGNPPGPAVAEGWDDWGPFYTPMYSQLVGLNGSTVEMCNRTDFDCGVPGSTTHPLGRIGARTAQYTVVWSTLLFDTENRVELMHDQLEIYRRGVTGAPRPECCPPPFDVANNWMYEYPKAYVIPLGNGQRSNPEANRLVEWLLFNGIEVSELGQNHTFGGQTFEIGSYVVWMTQAHRGLAETALSIGVDVSNEISRLYAPPGAWSHGYLWGADVVTIPRGADFSPLTAQITKPSHLLGGVEPGRADRYALRVNSPTAVRGLNALLGDGVAAQLALGSFQSASGATLPAGSIIFGADFRMKNTLDRVGKDLGLRFQRVSASALPALDPVDRAPRIAVLTGAVNQDVWSLRDLDFRADPISTATLNGAAEDPLVNYDVIFNTGNYPSSANTTARARLQAFFARGGGYIGAGANGGNFLVSGVQVSGFTAATRSGNGRSGIIYWNNTGGMSSPIVGTYPAQDTAIVDPPTWFTAVPSGWAIDGRLPLSGFFAAGLWLIDELSASAGGSTVIAHGTNTAGTSRLTLFAMNPLYRADPEREWPAVSGAAYWADQ